MELKAAITNGKDGYCTVIIEPYWNWKEIFNTNKEEIDGYNWTLLELKESKEEADMFTIESYNWTLLELKVFGFTEVATDFEGYNWTLLELKARKNIIWEIL